MSEGNAAVINVGYNLIVVMMLTASNRQQEVKKYTTGKMTEKQSTSQMEIFDIVSRHVGTSAASLIFILFRDFRIRFTDG